MSVLASGIYVYSQDGIVQPITEPWTLSPDGAALRLKGERLREGKALLRVDATFTRARCTGLTLDWLAGTPRTLEYSLQKKAIAWREDGETGKAALPAGGLLFPLLRAATGPLVTTLAETPGFVVVPSLHHPESKRFLRPEVTPRRATHLGNRYQYYGGEYEGDGCECWIDAHGLLTRYTWKTSQGHWDVRLEDLRVDAGFSFR